MKKWIFYIGIVMLFVSCETNENSDDNDDSTKSSPDTLYGYDFGINDDIVGYHEIDPFGSSDLLKIGVESFIAGSTGDDKKLFVESYGNMEVAYVEKKDTTWLDYGTISVPDTSFFYHTYNQVRYFTTDDATPLGLIYSSDDILISEKDEFGYNNPDENLPILRKELIGKGRIFFIARNTSNYVKVEIEVLDYDHVLIHGFSTAVTLQELFD